MNKVLTAFLISFTAIQTTFAQEKQLRLEIEGQAIGTTNDVVPFWMRSNQFGSVPVEGASASFIGRAYKEYEKGTSQTFDWGAGFEGRVNAGSDSRLLLIEGYAKAKAGIFQLKAGRTRDVMGLNGDTILTSGNFSISGNALGVPKIEISIPEYYTIPIWDGLFAFKGNFSHGWMGRKRILDTVAFNSYAKIFSGTNHPNTYLHQKSFYGRLGKQDWRFKLYGGFNHLVFWGSEKKIYGDGYDLSSLETFLYVATGKAYGDTTNGIPRSKIGNQLGSIDIGMEYNFDNIKLFIYRQNFYDVGALAKLANIRDGLNGISIQNLKTNTGESFRWNKMIFEFLYTKNQAGELWSKKTKSGDENYYNNYFYKNGWSYNGVGLGTPFISTKTSTREGQASDPDNYFINNRVIAFHAGLNVSIYSWDIISKLSYSRNFGTYGTSPIGHSLNTKRTPPIYGLFKEVEQFSGYIKGTRALSNNFRVGITAAVDRGQLLYNSIGGSISLSKSF